LVEEDVKIAARKQAAKKQILGDHVLDIANCREDSQECRGDCKRVCCYRRVSTIFSLWSICGNGREILFCATEIQIRDW
jgi:hypothetical protein